MKTQFDRGEDPISAREDEVDINSVAGLLKLYFRQLDGKLFPSYVVDDLLQSVSKWRGVTVSKRSDIICWSLSDNNPAQTRTYVTFKVTIVTVCSTRD